MARTKLDGGVAVSTDYTKINDNYDLDDALQTATGLPEEAVNLGSFTLPTAAALATTDTLRSAILKLGARASAVGTKYDATNTARSARMLGDDYDYKADDTAFEGTTNVTTSGNATTLDYPDGAGIYTLVGSRSGAAGAQSAGYNLTLFATKGAGIYARVKFNGTWFPWRQLGAAGGQSVSIDFDVADWSAASGGEHTLTIAASTHGLSRFVEVSSVCEFIGGTNLEPTVVDYSITDASGNITLTVSETPDNRFDGRIILRSYTPQS